MTDTWVYQGRQQHMWFGHGTKPKDVDGKDVSATSTPPASLAERVATLGHTLIAGLPASRRSHAVSRLDADDRGRLGRVMTGTARALPLGPRLTALRVFGTHPDAPGVADVVRSERLLKEASTAEGMRAATDALAQGAMAIGLDQFRPFLRRADDHLTATGGEAALVRDVSLSDVTHSSGTIDSNQVSIVTAQSRTAADMTVMVASGPTVPPPASIPGGPWTWFSEPHNSRGGKFRGSNGATASWDALDGHWDVDNGQGQRTRYNRFGAPLTPEEAHSPYKGPPRLPLPFRLFRIVPPIFLLPEQQREILGEREPI